MKFPLAILILLLFSTQLFPYCAPQNRSIHLAAVAGESDGVIFRLDVRVQPGTGMVYTAVSPLTGFSTQESEAAAASYAFSQSGQERGDCDVFYTIHGDFFDNKVDGPSAGAAMAAATLAALKNTGIRSDMVMTGTISPDGKIGEVGGVVEKSFAASDAGARYILVPHLQLYEALAISSAFKGGNFHAIEVSDLSDAARILSSPYSQEFNSTISPKSSPLPNLTEIKYDAELGRFALVASGVINELRQTSEETAGGPYSKYFSDEISKYDRLLALGYPFSAANSAFLLSVDAQFLKLGDSPIDLEGSASEAEACVSSLSNVTKTRQNFHWAVGADLRKIWAKTRFNETVSRDPGEREAYSSLRDLLFVKSWCGISRDLSAQAGEIGGEEVDESILASLAEEKLLSAEKEFDSADSIDPDALWHYKTALEANKSGLYGAAIYDATYARAVQTASNDRENRKESLAEEARNLSTQERNSLWGKIYSGQGKFLYVESKGDPSYSQGAQNVLIYSKELDSSVSEIDEALLKNGREQAVLANPAGNGEEKGLAKTAGDAAAALSGIALAGFALLCAYSLVKNHNPAKR